MATYETEEEQVEAIKKWWKENGISVFTGILLGVALLGGWRWWQTHSDQQAQLASGIYEQVLFSLENKQVKQAHDLAGQLLSDYSGSPYAVLAVLNLARQDLDDGDIDSSHARLQWVIDQNGDINELTHIARLRKARLFLSQEKLSEANALIEGISISKFKGAYAELRGDVALAQGQIDAARTAYIEALGSHDLSPQHHDWIQLKRDNLGFEKEARIEGSAPFSTIGHPNTMQETVLTETSVQASAMGHPSTTQETVLTETSAQASAIGHPSTMQETILIETSVQASAMGNPSTTQEMILTVPAEPIESLSPTVAH